jgi:hypothetical protein
VNSPAFAVASPLRHALRQRVAVAAVTVAASLAVLAPAAGASTRDARVVIGAGAPLGHVTTVALPARTSFAVVLRPNHVEALNRFVQAVSTPGSAMFRHFLKPGEFERLYAPSGAERRRVNSFLHSYGLTTTPARASVLIEHVSGPTSAIARAFTAHLVAIHRGDGTTATQFLGAATLPRDVARDLAGVVGLSTWMRPHNNLVVPHATAKVTTPGTCNGLSAAFNNGSVPLTSFTPAQQARAYGINLQWANGYNAAGQTIAVYELSSYDTFTVKSYFSCFSLHPTIATVNVDGGSTDSVGEQEAQLDIEEAGVLAPGAKLVIYKGPNNDQGPIDLYGQIASDDSASTVSTSWGMCESATGQAAAISSEQVFFNAMAAQGQTVLAAAGDDGSSDCASANGDTSLQVDDPASQPTVTGVGGLTVNSLPSTNPTRLLSEQVWNSGGGSGAGGGGISTVWPQPSWQTGDGVPVNAHRLVPDLSVMADPQTGFVAYLSNIGWSNIGGTSIGSPIVAAIVATANQSCGGRLGNINPALYAMAAHGVGFNDVTFGNNAIYSAAAGHYQAGPGYDMASGLGSPDPATFIPQLCSALPSVGESSVTVGSSTPVSLTSPAIVTVTVKNGKGAGIAYLTPTLTANETGAAPNVTPLTTYTDSSGSISYEVSTSTPGLVTLSASVGSVALGTTSVTFVGTATVDTRSLAALPVPVTSQRAASAGHVTTLVGVAANGHVLVTTTSLPRSLIVDVSARLHLAPASGAPALGCSGASCVAVVDIAGHPVALYNVNTPLGASATDLASYSSTLTTTSPNSLSLDDHRNAGYFDVAFTSASRHVLVAHVLVRSRTAFVTDLTIKDRLSSAPAGATSIVSANVNQRYVAVRGGGGVTLVADGLASGPSDVVTTSNYGGTAIVGDPVLARDATSGRLRIVARGVGGLLTIFTATGASPTRLNSAITLATGATTSDAVLSRPSAPGASDLVAYCAAGHLFLAGSPAWNAVAVTQPAPLSAPAIVAGPTPLVLASGAYYAVSP